MQQHTVYLTTRDSTRIELTVKDTGHGTYHLVGAQGQLSLEGQSLAFDVPQNDPEVVNHDFESDSFTVFAQSEALQSGELTIGYRGVFKARSLEALQRGLDRLRGGFIDAHEY